MESFFVSCIQRRADNPTGIKVTIVSFFFSNRPDEKTKDYGRLVHKLLSHYVEGQCAWVDKYPTSRHIPMVSEQWSSSHFAQILNTISLQQWEPNKCGDYCEGQLLHAAQKNPSWYN